MEKKLFQQLDSCKDHKKLIIITINVILSFFFILKIGKRQHELIQVSFKKYTWSKFKNTRASMTSCKVV